jgi:hypothetical protein
MGRPLDSWLGELGDLLRAAKGVEREERQRAESLAVEDPQNVREQGFASGPLRGSSHICWMQACRLRGPLSACV